ncbi:Thioredoxin [BD1-7 clade bacterium]|uniref:Thioredoxin n=1 Tax=BD1-7 clade bacterium TaxID=2029982 RepID=A0A5S9QPV9_9GAMM|nr:Thioredoxin [BD1-7 clade bacterium]CAA0122322.1 Thioredoxin [BD1-7 clade bacterium]
MDAPTSGINVNGRDIEEPLVLLWFSAQWCGPCKQLNPVMETVVGAYKGRVRIFKIDVDKQQDLVQQYAIRSVPTLTLLGSKGIADQRTGLISVTDIRQWLDHHLANENANQRRAS